MNAFFLKISEFFNKKSTAERICYFFLLLALFVFSFAILFRAEWIIGDDFETLQTTAIGRAESITRHIGQEHVANGRFYPLGHYDLNMLTLIPCGKSPFAHYLYIFLQFLTFSFILWKITGINWNNHVVERKKGTLSLYSRTILLLFLIFSSGFSWIFIDINYPERFLILLLGLFILFGRKAMITQKTAYFLLALIIAAYSSYMKEPVFGIFCVIAASFLVFSEKKSKKDSIFCYFLLSNGIIFLVLYYFLAFRGHTSVYTSSAVTNVFSLISRVFHAEKANIVIILLAAYRFFRIVFKKEKDQIFADSLLFASAGYVSSYILLGLAYPYYFSPALLLAIPAFANAINTDKVRGISALSVKYALCVFLLAMIFVNLPLFKENIAMSYMERTTDMAIIRTVAEHKTRGGTLYWHIPTYLPNNPINPTISGQRHIYDVFIDYVLGDYSSVKIPGSRNIFALTRDVVDLKDEDVFFLPVYVDEDARPVPFPKDIMEMLEKYDFVALNCNLVHIRIFVKKGSYIEPNWLLNRTMINEQLAVNN